MREFANTFLLFYAGLFPIVNPVGSAPVFLGLTRDSTQAERTALAGRVAVNGFLLLLGSVFVGSHVLEFFGITLPAVRVAGGLIVTAFGWNLLHSDQPSADQRDSKAATRRGPTDAFYPLTMPLTVGPGSIAVAVTLGSQRPNAFDLAHITNFLAIEGGAVCGLIAIALTVYVCYRSGERVEKVLGPGGTSVLVRLSAFILVCIGIEIIWNGYSAFMGHGG